MQSSQCYCLKASPNSHCPSIPAPAPPVAPLFVSDYPPVPRIPAAPAPTVTAPSLMPPPPAAAAATDSLAVYPLSQQQSPSSYSPSHSMTLCMCYSCMSSRSRYQQHAYLQHRWQQWHASQYHSYRMDQTRSLDSIHPASGAGASLASSMHTTVVHAHADIDVDASTLHDSDSESPDTGTDHVELELSDEMREFLRRSFIRKLKSMCPVLLCANCIAMYVS
jgi:hypothetical protein